MKSIRTIRNEWENLGNRVVYFYYGEPFDSVSFQEAVFDTFEYFKHIEDRENPEIGYFLSPEESGVLARVYAYGKMEDFDSTIEADDDCLASFFVAMGLYETIIYSLFGECPEEYTFTADFKYCDRNGKEYTFNYNVKTGDMSEILSLIEKFRESGWPDEKHCLNYGTPDIDIEDLKESLE